MGRAGVAEACDQLQLRLQACTTHNTACAGPVHGLYTTMTPTRMPAHTYIWAEKALSGALKYD